MSKINLFQAAEEFYSSVENLNNPNSKEIADFKKTYIFAKGHLNVLNAKTIEAVAEWKNLQSEIALDEEADIIVDQTKIIQQAKLVKFASLAVQIVAACTCMVALVAFVVNYTFATSTVLLAGVTAAVIAINRGKIRAFTEINSENYPEGYFAYVGHLFSQKIALSLNRLKIIRQNRVYKSENFARFVEKFVETNEFKVNKRALSNLQLHVLYLKYKYALKTILKLPKIRAEAV